jgi:ADP-ribosylglycohydrolase
LLASGGDPQQFARNLSRRLRWWLAAVPAGVGKATALGTLRLWLRFPPDRSGVWSAGNGPAMRSPILGVAFGHDPARLHAMVRASTVLTHRDPKAEYGAYAVALAAYHASQSRNDPSTFVRELADRLGDEVREFHDLVRRASASAGAGESTETFANQLGLSRAVSGYVYHTVPVVLHAWMRHPADYRAAVEAVVRCGGDTDTTAAIVGGIVGSGVGKAGIPAEWLAGVCEWPRSVGWIERLGQRLADGRGPQSLFWPAVPVRNAFFFVLVLMHAARRLLPPY